MADAPTTGPATTDCGRCRLLPWIDCDAGWEAHDAPQQPRRRRAITPTKHQQARLYPRRKKNEQYSSSHPWKYSPANIHITRIKTAFKAFLRVWTTTVGRYHHASDQEQRIPHTPPRFSRKKTRPSRWAVAQHTVCAYHRAHRSTVPTVQYFVSLSFSFSPLIYFRASIA